MNKFYALYHRESQTFCFRINWIDKLDFSSTQPPALWKNIGLAKGNLTRTFNKRKHFVNAEWDEFFLGIEVVEVTISLGKSEYSNLFSIEKFKKGRSGAS